MDECTVGFGDHAAACALLPPSSSMSGSHVVGEPLRTIPTLPCPLKAPLQPRCCCSSQCCHPRKCHINSSTAEAWEGWISGPAATMRPLVWGTETKLKRRERRVDGGEWEAVSGISLLIKIGFVSLLSVTLLLGWEAKWADTHVEGIGEESYTLC